MNKNLILAPLKFVEKIDGQYGLPGLKEGMTYETVLVEIVEINKTTGQAVELKNRISLQAGNEVVFSNLVTRALQSSSPTLQLILSPITSLTQFEASASPINTADTDVYEININFWLKPVK